MSMLHPTRLLMLFSSLLILAGLALSPVQPALAAGVVVNDLGDASHPCATTGSGTCSLRDAITYTNATPGGAISFGASGTITLGSALPIINQSLTLTGLGMTSTLIDGANTFRVFEIAPASSAILVTMTNLTIRHGFTAANGPAYNNDGAGIFVHGSPVTTLVLDHITLTQNNSGNGNGGGISVQKAFGSTGNTLLTITNSVISNNTSGGYGGGILCVSCALSLTSTQVTGNTANGTASPIAGGGGLYITGTAANGQINKNLFTGNQSTSTDGGAIFDYNGALTVAFNRVAGNLSASSATGLKVVADNASSGSVGGVDNWWGCNTGPSASPCDTVSANISASPASVTDTPWLMLALTVNPGSIPLIGQSTLSTSFSKDSGGNPISASSLDALAGAAVSFKNPILGALSNPQTAIQSAGQATATFTAGNLKGTGQADVTVDNATATVSISIGSVPWQVYLPQIDNGPK